MKAGGMRPDIVTDQTSAHDPLHGYLPQGWTADPRRRRSATAATFAATLELAKQGQIELRQADTFAPIAIRRRPVRE